MGQSLHTLSDHPCESALAFERVFLDILRPLAQYIGRTNQIRWIEQFPLLDVLIRQDWSQLWTWDSFVLHSGTSRDSLLKAY